MDAEWGCAALCLLLNVLTVPIMREDWQEGSGARIVLHVSHEESRVARRGLDEVGDIRLERMTSTMSTWRSNQLS